MTKSKDTKRRKAEQLGMPVGTAEKHLRKSVIHELASQLGKNICCRCNLPIEEPEGLALVHVQDWEDDSDLFWALTNIAFSHAGCEAARSGKRREEKREMSKVEIRVEDPNGKQLPGTRYEGQLYVAGKKNGRYQIRVRNKTRERILIITTVDGRNVQTGEPGGGHEDGGHVLEPHQSWTFTGWRTSNNEVAAFRFGKKGGAYSSQMGSPENVGVIGVAVFEEEAPPPRVITVKETQFVPMPYPVPAFPPPNPWSPYTVTWDSHTAAVPPSFSTTILGTSAGAAPVSTNVVNCSMSEVLGMGNRTSSSFTLTNSSSTTRARSSKQKGRVRQELGTEFGEQLHSQVRTTTFNRASDAPCEVWVIRYDSMDALQKRGIMGHHKPQEAPQAFPESPWGDGPYCKPPPQSAYKP